MTRLEVAEEGLAPMAVVARTLSLYVLPLVRPLTVPAVAAAAAVAVITDPPVEVTAVTVYPVIGEPPLLAGGVHVTLADALPALASPIVGAAAADAGVTGSDSAEAALSPMALMATTRRAYECPFVRPVTVPLVAAAPTVAGAAADMPVEVLTAVIR